MIFKKATRIVLILLIVFLNIGCDQLSKKIVRQKINYDESITLIDNHFTLTKIENSGAFLSFGDSFPTAIKFVVLLLLPIAALVVAFLFMLTKTNLSTTLVVGLCFALGGGIGNLYDRILYGSVTDFLHIDFGFFQTGIFNMADVSIMTGMFMILVHSYFKRPTLN